MTASLILASASRARASMLERAGVPHEIDPSGVDEDAVKAHARAVGLGPEPLAAVLAREKALAVASRRPMDLVLGADQVLAFADAVLDKPRTPAVARAQLSELRGQTHQLVSAACLATAAGVLWEGAASVELVMRDFSDTFLDDYLADMGDGVTETVGGYRLEDRGAQLFSEIHGDYFTVLGLPLLPVLEALRGHGVLSS